MGCSRECMEMSAMVGALAGTHLTAVCCTSTLHIASYAPYRADCKGAALHSSQCRRAVPAGILCTMRCNLLNGVASSYTVLQHSARCCNLLPYRIVAECQTCSLRAWPRTKCIFRCRRPAASGE